MADSTLPIADTPTLTIITVAIEKHFDYIRRQIQMIDALNPGADWRMIVVDNSTDREPRLSLDDRRCTVIPGVPTDLAISENCRGSYHHAAALNRAAALAKTRWVLVLDPDLFVLYRHWIAECIAHMERGGLTFFGVPWHPRWFNKVRYFPCVHFLMIDQDRLPVSRVDFMPQIEGQPGAAKPGPLAALLSRIPVVGVRRRIHSSRDTGWRMWTEFGRTGRHRYDTALPLVDLQRHLTKPRHLQTKRGRWLERVFPRRWRYLPPLDSYVEPPVSGFQHPTLDAVTPEMFVWRGAPFAFHLRRHVRDTVDKRTDQSAETARLETFLAAVAQTAPWTSWTSQRART